MTEGILDTASESVLSEPVLLLTDDDLWRAVTEQRYVTGVYAVRSTGIYCRTDCPSRRPNRSHVRFFARPADAEAAGFRACKRCRPEQAEREADDLARLLGLLETDTPSTLNALAAASGLDAPTIRKLFRRDLGVSVRAYVQERRAERLRRALQNGEDVTGALYGAGYGSSRSLYERAGETLGMTPGTYRRGGAGVTIRFTVFETELGPCLVAATEKGVCALRFGEGEVELRAEFSEAVVLEDAETLAPFVRAVRAYLAGERGLELPLDVSPTAFQAKVWTALRRIPYGETRSYAEVAAELGDARAVRAVAGACAKNPVALAVPCHRVVRADGSLSGYRWGGRAETGATGEGKGGARGCCE